MQKFYYFLIMLVLATNASHARLRGGDSSGGGDGIVRDGHIVLRDFVADLEPELIGDNQEFLSAIPELVDLISEIGRVNPSLAISIWNDLNEASLWIVNQSLKTLPPEYTSLTNVVADIQLAIRDGRDIFLAKEFNDYKHHQGYLLIHESLHRFVPESGDAHHHKVRAIIRYLKENRGHLEQIQFNTFLQQLGINEKLETTLAHELSIIFDSSKNDEHKCTVLQNHHESALERFKSTWGFRPICDTLGDVISITERLPDIKEYLIKLELISNKIDNRLKSNPYIVINIEEFVDNYKLHFQTDYLCNQFANESFVKKLNDSNQELINIIQKAKNLRHQTWKKLGQSPFVGSEKISYIHELEDRLPLSKIKKLEEQYLLTTKDYNTISDNFKFCFQ